MNKFIFQVFCALMLSNISVLAADSSEEHSSEELQKELSKHLGSALFKIDDLLTAKCQKKLGDEEKGTAAAAQIKEDFQTLTSCLGEHFNFSTLPEEIEKAKPTGDLDVVFNKYCGKRTQGLECVETFNQKVKPCLNADEQVHQENLINILKSIIDFVCHKNGDQIALFFAENGPECFDAQKENLKQCVNSTFADYMPKDGKFTVLPEFTLTTKQCLDIKQFHNCVVNQLKSCNDITPSNLFDALVRFVKKRSPCKDV